MKSRLIELHALEETDLEARIFTKAVNAGLTTEHLFTGSIPMKSVDYKLRWADERKSGDILFGIWLPKGKFVGTCGLHSHRDIYRSWEARFLIFDAGAVGKGIGKDVVSLLTEYGFSRLNAHRIWLGVSADNLRAVKCYLDCGYAFEGRMRDELFYAGRYHDALRMAALEDSWRRH